MNRHLQAVPPSSEQADRDLDRAGAVLKVGDVLPARLDRAAMCQIFGIGHSQFHRLCRQGKFRRFELKPRVGRTAWSGRLVQLYLDGPVAKRA